MRNFILTCTLLAGVALAAGATNAFSVAQGPTPKVTDDEKKGGDDQKDQVTTWYLVASGKG